MSNFYSAPYCVPITEPSKDESSIYRHPLLKKELIRYPDENTRNLKDVLLNSCAKYKNCPFLGTKDANGVYQWKSYENVKEISTSVGAGLIKMNLVPKIKEYKEYEVRLLGFSAKNREEYFLIDFACVLYGITAVPIYDTLGDEGIDYILEQTRVTTLVLSEETILKYLKHDVWKNVQNIICLDKIKDEETLSKLNKKKIRIIYIDELIKLGENNQINFPQYTPETLYVLSYTSGTTGVPKGAMMSHAMYVSSIPAMLNGFYINENEIHISYLPLAHALERVVIWSLIYRGGALGMYNGDILKLRDDLQALRPTFMVIVPRLLNRFHELIASNISQLTGFKKWLFEKALSTKLSNLHESNTISHCFYDALVFSKIRAIFGGRLRIMGVGSAPTRKETLDFMKVVLSIPIIEGYGQTETSGASFLLRESDYNGSCTVGGPTSNVEFKLVDIPEMNYSKDDKDEFGKSTPRGEICMRGYGVFPGYYKDQQRTDEVLEKNGWIHTGDVGQIMVNGAMKIIDRKKNIFKLSQGEYIASEKLETIYANCKFVSEIFVYGDSFQNFVVAIVVPRLNTLMDLAKSLGINQSEGMILKNKEIRIAVLEAMKVLGKEKKLNGMEIVKNVYLEKDPFATLNLTTTTFKLQRFSAKKHFQTEINRMYEEGQIV